MGYNRYIYSDATLKAKAANNQAGLLKNKKRSDIVAYGIVFCKKSCLIVKAE